jgi:hypothetical protein
MSNIYFDFNCRMKVSSYFFNICLLFVGFKLWMTTAVGVSIQRLRRFLIAIHLFSGFNAETFLIIIVNKRFSAYLYPEF